MIRNRGQLRDVERGFELQDNLLLEAPASIQDGQTSPKLSVISQTGYLRFLRLFFWLAICFMEQQSIELKRMQPC